jgi:hypothetical protein
LKQHKLSLEAKSRTRTFQLLLSWRDLLGPETEPTLIRYRTLDYNSSHTTF